MHIKGYILRDTVVETIEGAMHTHPYPHIIISHPPLQPNNYEYPTLVVTTQTM